jgi:hypothetical protein
VSVDPESATATLTDNGTLRVELPKVETDEDRPVEIATEEDDGTDVGTTDVGTATGEFEGADSTDEE